jgi:hypothetical protein
MTSQPGPRLNAAFYADSVAAFLRASDDEVYAPLASPHGYTLATAKAICLAQLSAWRLQLPVLPIEFKVGAKKFQQADYEQAWDFRLDLKNFHAPSHAAAIFPILCATDTPKSDRRWKPPRAARPRLFLARAAARELRGGAADTLRCRRIF